MYCCGCLLRAFGFDSMTNSSARFRHAAQECERAALVEVLVEVAALRALHAGRAAVVARPALEQPHRVGDPALELVEAALGAADAAGVAVVGEDGRRARV